MTRPDMPDTAPGHGRQLDARVFEHPVDAVRLAYALLNRRLPNTAGRAAKNDGRPVIHLTAFRR